MKEELKITREMIVHDYRHPSELDAAREDNDNNIKRLQDEINYLCERSEMFDELRSLSEQVEGVTPSGVPYWDAGTGDYEEVADYHADYDTRSATVMKRDPTGELRRLDGRREPYQFSYVFDIGRNKLYGENDNWTLDEATTLALHYIDTGLTPKTEEKRWYLVWGHTNNWGWKEVGKFECGPDKAEAERALETAKKMAIGEFEYRLEVVNI